MSTEDLLATCIVPDLGTPATVGALMSTRLGGHSAKPFDGFNLGTRAGDDAATVAAHRRLLSECIAARPVFLRQVHGCKVVRLQREHLPADDEVEADASITTEVGLACTVMVADCLPVLFCAAGGLGVAAAHAGWRGLAGGVLEQTVAGLCEASACAPAELQAWLGPCIGRERFEVGADVVQAFDGGQLPASRHFKPSAAAGKWLADLPGLARDRLAGLGVDKITGGGWCTVSDARRFFSFRRDGQTGRMAACVWLRR